MDKNYNKTYPYKDKKGSKTAIKEIAVYTLGDASLLSTWSNVPYFFTKNLVDKGYIIHRINIAPNKKIETVYNRTFVKLLSVFFRKHTFCFERSRLNRYLTNRVIKNSTKLYPNIDLNIFLTFSYTNIYSRKPSCLFGDWTYDLLIRKRQQREPYFFEKDFIRFENKNIEKASLVISLFPKCTEYMKSVCANRHIHHLGGNVINSCYEGDLIPDKIVTIKKNSNKILFIGNNKYLDGARLLLSSFKELQHRIPGIELHIIGLSESSFSDIPDHVYFYGYLRKEVPEERNIYYNLMIHSRVFVNPTPVWGGYSSTIEAMYFYNPVIISPYEDFVNEFGSEISFGNYCTEFSESYLSASIYRMFTDDEYHMQLCKNAHHAVESYTWSSYIDKLLNKIKEVI